MKNKNLFKLFLIILGIVITIILVTGFLFWGKDKEVSFIEEYTPEEEISEEARKTNNGINILL